MEAELITTDELRKRCASVSYITICMFCPHNMVNRDKLPGPFIGCKTQCNIKAEALKHNLSLDSWVLVHPVLFAAWRLTEKGVKK